MEELGDGIDGKKSTYANIQNLIKKKDQITILKNY